jgi:AmiR/NasT family two-component response regulator
LYSRDRHAFDGSFEVAELFATQAALVLGFSRTIQNLNHALGSRTVIGQAVGIVMERYGMDQTRAFDYLSRLSQNSNTKLRIIADNLVNEVAAGVDSSSIS